MRDAKSLLDSFLGQIQQPNGQPPARGGQGQGFGSGGLSGLSGGASGLNLDAFLSGKGGLATGAVVGGLAGLLMGGGKPKKIAKNVLQLGGMALVGGLAYKAWNDWQAKKAGQPQSHTPSGATPPPLPAPDESRFIPMEQDAQDDLSEGLIRAMIAAAKADGHISDEERSRITEQLGTVQLNAELMAFINAEMAAPLDVGKIAAAAKTPEQAAEIYAASLLCIDSNGPAERGYLAMLAARLNLPQELVEQIHASVDSVMEY